MDKVSDIDRVSNAGRILCIDRLPSRNPLNGTFELTLRCNLHCKMCLFRQDDSENARLMQEELTADQWIQMAREAAEAGTIHLLITGGEAMLRPDFCRIWEEIYQMGFLIQLYTNATLVTDEIMATLRKCPPHDIGITIYGSNPDSYQNVCGDAAAFDRMVHGVHRLMELPSAISYRTTIIKDNYADVQGIERLVAQEFGYTGVVSQTQCVLPAVRGGCSKARECRLDPIDNVHLIFHRGIDQMRQLIGDDFDISRVRIEIKQMDDCRVEKEKLTFFGCSAGMTNYTISYNGKLRPCQIMDAFTTDARAEGLAEAWNKLPTVIELPGENADCIDCEYAPHCQTCYASRLAETGSLTACPPYIRDIAIETSKMKYYKRERV